MLPKQYGRTEYLFQKSPQKNPIALQRGFCRVGPDSYRDGQAYLSADESGWEQVWTLVAPCACLIFFVVKRNYQGCTNKKSLPQINETGFFVELATTYFSTWYGSIIGAGRIGMGTGGPWQHLAPA